MPNQQPRDVNPSRLAQPAEPQNLTFTTAFRNPIKLRSDVLMSIRQEHMGNIAAGTKNYEYRKYLLPSSVKRIWFYTSTPVSSIQYVAQISRGRVPGEVPEDGGIGNDDFNAGRKISNYGYEIHKLWRLRMPITLATARKRGFLKGPPQKYNWAPARLIDEIPLEKEECVINRREKRAERNDASDAEERPAKMMKTTSPGKE